MARVLLIGIAVQDYVFALDAIPTTPEKHRARDVAVVGGGLAANAAVAVSRLGGEAIFLGRFGDDSVGRDIREALTAEGVDCSGAAIFPGRRSPLSAVLVDRHGERLVVNYADPDMPGGTEWLPRTLPANLGAVMADSRWEAGSAHILACARAAGIPAVLDLDRGIGDVSLVATASHTAMSLQALRELGGGTDPVAGLTHLRARFGNWLAVTDGARGTWFTEAEGIAHEPAFPITPLDTLAAGDVYHGALALALAERMPPRTAVRFASATAAIKCTRFGGRAGTPTRPEVDAFLARSGEPVR